VPRPDRSAAVRNAVVRNAVVRNAAAWGALGVGLAYAAVSAYWAVGGTALLAAAGGVFERWGQSRSAAVAVLLWAVVAMKVVAAVLPGLAVRGTGPASAQRPVRILAWASGLILTAYGAVLTVTGLAVQSGLIHAGAGADHRALRWHAYLWDPWFLLWGVLTIMALSSGRPSSR
jgi:Protein of unknown function (DUF3995)